jgi:predicted O-methyltransferase YrrM
MPAVRRIVRHWINHAKDQLALAELEVPCDASPLGRVDEVDLHAAFSRNGWETIEPQVAALGISTRVHGVNPGDRRALYMLVKHLAPHSVLEVGTHVGASTTHIALAIKDTGGHLDSVDIVDVNDRTNAPWVTGESRYSPAEMIERLGCDVTFHAQNSLDYLENCQRKYDLVFLDDLHASVHVYRELPLALQRLNHGGYVILHNYFPHDQPLWSNRHVIHGPYRAVRKYQKQGVPFKVKPFGALPWPTKFGSNRTSLALLGR